MKGVIFEQAGVEPKVSDGLEKPKPSSDQILVKSVYTAINPVDTYMSSSGLLVTAWPFVLGCDAAGVVVEVGENASAKFKNGDEVCGCTRLGVPGHSTAQQYFLMDAALTMPKPKNVTIQQAATLGVGTYTAALGIFNGLKIPLPDLDSLPGKKSDDESEVESKSSSLEKKDGEKGDANKDDAAPKVVDDPPPDSSETKADPPKSADWVVVLGGASSVGKYAIQLAIACGYKVVASCSASSAPKIQALGAQVFDYKQPLPRQAADVLSLTSRKPYRIFDAAATGDALAKEIFNALPDDGAEKFFTTTNDWSNLTDFSGGTTTVIALGHIGRSESAALNADMERFIPVLGALVEGGLVAPSPYDVVGGAAGWADVIEALKYQQRGAGGSNKVLAKIPDE